MNLTQTSILLFIFSLSFCTVFTRNQIQILHREFPKNTRKHISEMTKQSYNQLVQKHKQLDIQKPQGKNKKQKNTDKESQAELAELEKFMDDFSAHTKFLHQEDNLKSSVTDSQMSNYYDSFLDLIKWLGTKGKLNSKFIGIKHELRDRIEEYEISNDKLNPGFNEIEERRSTNSRERYRNKVLAKLKAEQEEQKKHEPVVKEKNKDKYAHLRKKNKFNYVPEPPKEKVKINLPVISIESSKDEVKIVESVVNKPVVVQQSKKEETVSATVQQKKKKARIIVVEMLTEDDCLNDNDLKKYLGMNK